MGIVRTNTTITAPFPLFNNFLRNKPFAA